jgi:hypothetical protein
MPWAKRTVRGCCYHCHQEYGIATYNFGPSWHRCGPADSEKKRLRNAANREYHRKRQAEKGKTVIKRAPRIPGNERWLSRQQEMKGVKKITPRTHVCKRCGVSTVNYWHCPNCLSVLSSAYNMDIYVEEGCSRRMGVRAR